MMESVAEDMATGAKKLLNELLTKIETTSKTLTNNMETVASSALHQLTQPFEDLEKKIASSQCQPKVELEQLKQQIYSDLAACTQNIQEILNTFQRDSNEFKTAFEKNIKDIIDLPKKCKTLNNTADITSYINCYIENIVSLNQQIANILNNVSEGITETRQLAAEAFLEGHTCANEVITSTKTSFNKIVSTCSEILQQ